MRKIIIIKVSVLLIALSFSPIIMLDVNALVQDYNSNADLDGMIWFETLEGVGTTINVDNISTFMTVGRWRQDVGGLFNFARYDSFVSFDTSTIPTAIEIIDVLLNIKVKNIPAPTELPYNVVVTNVDYGDSLTSIDWLATGEDEGTLCSSEVVAIDEWVSMPVSTERINLTTRTQYRLTSSRLTDPKVDMDETLDFYTADSSYAPYLSVTTTTQGGAIISYNFTNAGAIPTNATVEYWDEHANATFDDGFESGSFITGGWTTFGSPVVSSSYSPYAGNYHAGASFGTSGAGNHTFEIAIDTTGQDNITFAYYRFIQDLGGGTVSLVVDWYNGTAWNIVESLTVTSSYTQSLWELNSTADGNPNLIFRFNVTLTAGAVNNGAWVDEVEIFSTTGYHIHSNSTIYPSEVLYWNDSAEQIRYEVYICTMHPTLESWIHLHVNSTYTYQSTHPNTINVTDEGGGQINISDAQHQDTFHSFWFLKPINPSYGTNQTSIVYPEIQPWNNTANIYKYWIWTLNETWLNIQVNNSYTYLSVHPACNITLLNATTGLFNMTETEDYVYHQIWFLVDKPVILTRLHIRLWHSTLGEGQPDWKWKITINPGNTYNNTTAQWVYDPLDWPVVYGNNYTLAVLDYFDNEIANISIRANNLDMSILIPVDIYTLQAVNYRQGTSHLSIFFNATGTPFSWPIVANDIFVLPIRTGSYMFRVTPYYWNADNTSEVAGTPAFFNITIDADYNFYIGNSYIAITYWNTEGIEVDVNTIVTLFGPDQIIMQTEPALSPTEPVAPGEETPYFIDPWFVISATVRNSADSNSSGAVSLAIPGIDTSAMAGTVLFLKDLLGVSATNTSADMLINNSETSTNFIDVKAPAGTDYDILLDYYTHRGANLTVWTESGPISANREQKYRQSQRFWWENWVNQSYYLATVTINNSLSQQILEPHVFVAFDNGTDPDLDTVRVYDQNNNRYLTPGTGFSVDYTGVAFMFVNLSSGSQRTFTIDYFKDNASRLGEAWIDAEAPPEPTRRDGKSMFFVYGRYTNSEPSIFTGTIKFALDFSGASDILPETIIVVDRTTGNVLGRHSHWRYTASAIEILPTYVGELGIGETISIGLYYQTDEEIAGGFFDTEVAFSLTLPELLVIISLLGIVIGLVVRSSKEAETKEMGSSLINAGILILTIVGAVGLLLIVIA